MAKSKNSSNSNSSNPSEPATSKYQDHASRFDQGAISILAPSHAAAELALLLGKPDLSSLRAAAAPFKFSRAKSDAAAAAEVLAVHQEGARLSPSAREGRLQAARSRARRAAQDAHTSERAKAWHWIGLVRFYEPLRGVVEDLPPSERAGFVREMERARNADNRAALAALAKAASRNELQRREDAKQRQLAGLEALRDLRSGRFKDWGSSRGYRSSRRVPASAVWSEVHYADHLEAIKSANAEELQYLASAHYGLQGQMIECGNPRLTN